MATDGQQPIETIEIKAKRLRTALRAARTEAGMIQRDAAKALYWSVSKIVRIEQGTVPVTPTDVQAMLKVYGMNDHDRVAELVELARTTRENKRAGWQTFSKVYSKQALELFGSERAASAIYEYEPTLMPGIFQTADYARAVLRALGNSREIVNRKLEARLARQDWLDDTPRPEINVVLGEAVLSRPIGGQRVMRDQVEALKKYAKTPGININVLPFSAGEHRGLASSGFTILQFDSPTVGDMIYLENNEGESVTRDNQRKIKSYLDLYVELQDLADQSGDFDKNLDTVTRKTLNIQ